LTTAASEPADLVDPAPSRVVADSSGGRVDLRIDLATCAVVAALRYRVDLRAPTPGLDTSWHVGMHLQALRPVSFGRDLLFTYGPLEWLLLPRFASTRTALASLAFSMLLHLVVAASLYALVRRSLRPLAAAGLLYVLLTVRPSLAGPETTAAAVVATLVLALLVHRAGAGPAVPWSRAGRALLPLAAATGGFLALVKTSTAVLTIGVVGLAALFVHRRRLDRVVRDAVVPALAVFSAGWFLSGGRIDGLADWARGSREIVSGYPAAMGIEAPGLAWHYPAAMALGATLVAAVAAAAMAVSAGRSSPGGMPEAHAGARRAALGVAVGPVLVVGAFLFVDGKAGFVRHDGHAIEYFAVLPMLAVAPLTVPGWSRRLAALVIVGASLAAFTVWPTFGLSAVELANPSTSVGRLARDASLLVRPGAVRAEVVDAKAAARGQLALDGESLAALAGRTVHVHPFETSAVWAYDLGWKPAPTFQSYQAYTPWLDRHNAATLSSADGPDMVLWGLAAAIDGRTVANEAPATTLALLCRFEPTGTTAGFPRWSVLERSAADRCGQPTPMASVEAASGEKVAVPGTDGQDALVVASFTPLRTSWSERIVAAVAKPTGAAEICLDEACERATPATLGGPVVVRMADGIAPDRPLWDGAGASTATVSVTAPGVDRFRVTFSTVAVRDR